MSNGSSNPPTHPCGNWWQRLVRGTRRLREEPDWARFAGAGWADRVMGVEVTDRFHAKQGRSIGRWVLESGGDRLAVYLKRHYRLPRWHGFLAALRPRANWSPALQEWHHLEWARAQGLPVPRAVAAGEYLRPWGRLQSFLAVEELAGMLPLHEAVPAAAGRLEPVAFRRWKRALAIELAGLVRAFHQRRYFHKDLYFCHFYIPEAHTRAEPKGPEGFGMHVIDLHRLARHRWTWRLWQIKDLAQLCYSSEVSGVDARDRVRFWRAYLGPARRTVFARLLRRCVAAKARRYQRHNERHPQVIKPSPAVAPGGHG